MLKKYAVVVAGFGLLAAACGGGSDATTTTSGAQAAAVDSDGGSSAPPVTANTAVETKSPTTTSPPTVSVGNSDYCLDADESDPLGIIDPFSADLKEQVETLLSLIDEMEASAPPEIADDVRILAANARTFAEVLAEYDYDLFSIPPDDPRFLAFQEPEVEQASRNIAAYCGIDIEDADGGAGIGGLADPIGTDDIPEGFPEALLPPGLEGLDDSGIGGLFISTSASFDDVYAYYRDLLGNPADEFEGSATFSADFEGRQRIVNVTDNPDGSTLVTIISF